MRDKTLRYEPISLLERLAFASLEEPARTARLAAEYRANQASLHKPISPTSAKAFAEERGGARGEVAPLGRRILAEALRQSGVAATRHPPKARVYRRLDSLTLRRIAVVNSLFGVAFDVAERTSLTMPRAGVTVALVVNFAPTGGYQSSVFLRTPEVRLRWCAKGDIAKTAREALALFEAGGVDARPVGVEHAPGEGTLVQY